MELKQVDPKTIKVPEIRVTARFDQDTLEQFRSSIKQVGAITPIICYDVDGDLVLVDGLHRLGAAMENGDKSINVAVLPGDIVDVLTKNIFLDHLRGKTPPTKMVKVIEALWKEYDLDSEKIAEKTGLTREYVEKLQRISLLTPLCREALDQERIGVGHAEILASIGDPIRQEMVLGQLELYRWKVAEFREYVRQVNETVQEPAQEPQDQVEREPYRVKCFYCRGDFDVGQIANPNTCVECSGSLLAAIAQANAEIKAEQIAPAE